MAKRTWYAKLTKFPFHWCQNKFNQKTNFDVAGRRANKKNKLIFFHVVE